MMNRQCICCIVLLPLLFLLRNGFLNIIAKCIDFLMRFLFIILFER